MVALVSYWIIDIQQEKHSPYQRAFIREVFYA